MTDTKHPEAAGLSAKMRGVQSAWGRLYTAANALVARIGYLGSLNSDALEVCSLMDKLAELDSGVWMPGLMPQLSTLSAGADTQVSLEALQQIVDLSAGWDKYGSIGPKQPFGWETVARLAMDYARSALSAEPASDRIVGRADCAEEAIRMLKAEPAPAPQEQSPGADIARLMKFYGSTSLSELVEAQSNHIERLQAKLPKMPSLAPTFPRG